MLNPTDPQQPRPFQDYLGCCQSAHEVCYLPLLLQNEGLGFSQNILICRQENYVCVRVCAVMFTRCSPSSPASALSCRQLCIFFFLLNLKGLLLGQKRWAVQYSFLNKLSFPSLEQLSKCLLVVRNGRSWGTNGWTCFC